MEGRGAARAYLLLDGNRDIVFGDYWHFAGRRGLRIPAIPTASRVEIVRERFRESAWNPRRCLRARHSIGWPADLSEFRSSRLASESRFSPRARLGPVRNAIAGRSAK